MQLFTNFQPNLVQYQTQFAVFWHFKCFHRQFHRLFNH